MTFHPQVIEKEGKKEFIVLPYDEYLKIQEALEEWEDLKEIRKEKELAKDQLAASLDQVAKELDL